MAEVQSGGISVSNGTGAVTVVFEDGVPVKVVDNAAGEVLYEAEGE